MSKQQAERPRIIDWQRHLIQDQEIYLPTIQIPEATLASISQDTGMKVDVDAGRSLSSAVARWIAYLNGYGEYGSYGHLGRSLTVDGVDATSTAGPYYLSASARKKVRPAYEAVRDALVAVRKFEAEARPDSLGAMGWHISTKLNGTDESRISPTQALEAVLFVLGRAVRKPMGERRFAEGEFRRELLKKVLLGEAPRNKDRFIESINARVLTPLNSDKRLVAPGRAEKPNCRFSSPGTASKSNQGGGASTALEHADLLFQQLAKMKPLE